MRDLMRLFLLCLSITMLAACAHQQEKQPTWEQNAEWDEMLEVSPDELARTKKRTEAPAASTDVPKGEGEERHIEDEEQPLVDRVKAQINEHLPDVDVTELPSEPVGVDDDEPSYSTGKACVKGCPCGNTCISCSKRCHVGRGSAYKSTGRRSYRRR